LPPADYAPRSYVGNGWYDYSQVTLQTSPFPYGMPESAIREPAATIVFGEKATESRHFWMDLSLGDDVFEIEHARHFRANSSDPRTGGSNFAMADGSVQFLRYGRSLAPTNLWAVIDEWRTNTVQSLAK
jgi:prepilin-type processing-associated H-X9-DG protein